MSSEEDLFEMRLDFESLTHHFSFFLVSDLAEGGVNGVAVFFTVPDFFRFFLVAFFCDDRPDLFES